MLQKEDYENLKNNYYEALAKATMNIDKDLQKQQGNRIYSNNLQLAQKEMNADRQNMNIQRNERIKTVGDTLQKEIFKDWGKSMEAAKHYVTEPDNNKDLSQQWENNR